jgi:hypothetical protein
MDDKKPSIERIFFTDYITTFSAISVLFALGFFAFDRLIKSFELGDQFPIIIGSVCIIGIALIIWRIRLITSAFEFGWEVEGDIVGISFFRDRGSVTYIYMVQGERFQTSNAIMKHRLTKSLVQGQKVVIVANKDNPKVAFIRDIYV